MKPYTLLSPSVSPPLMISAPPETRMLWVGSTSSTHGHSAGFVCGHAWQWGRAGVTAHAGYQACGPHQLNTGIHSNSSIHDCQQIEPTRCLLTDEQIKWRHIQIMG